MTYVWWAIILALLVALVHAVATAIERLRNNPLPIDIDALRTTCGAKPRPRHHEMGWECTGRDLVVLTRYRADDGSLPPAVIPRSALPLMLSQPWASTYGEPTTFPGGDHMHLTLPDPADRPATERRPAS